MGVLREIATRLGLSKKDTVVRALSATLAAGSGAAVNVPNVYAGAFSQNEAPVQVVLEAVPQPEVAGMAYSEPEVEDTGVQAGVAESPDAQVGAPSGILNRSEAARLALERSRINGKGWDRVEGDDKVVITRNGGVLASYQFPDAEYKFMIDRPDDVKAVTDINQGRGNVELVYVDPFPGRVHPNLEGVNFTWGVTLPLGGNADNPVQFKISGELDQEGDVLRVFVTFVEPNAIRLDSKAKFIAASPDEQKEVIRRLNRFVGEYIATDGDGTIGTIPETVNLTQSTDASPSAIILVPVA